MACPTRCCFVEGFRLGSLVWSFAGLVGYQVSRATALPGLANNSDFMKVLGPWAICSDHQPQNNQSLVTHYKVEPNCDYNLEITTLERPLVGVALGTLERVHGDRGLSICAFWRHFTWRFCCSHLGCLLGVTGALHRLNAVRHSGTLSSRFSAMWLIPATWNPAYMDAPAFARCCC